MRPRFVCLFICALLLANVALAADRPTPIAVMPFKNLNADPNLSWLTVGIAETMLSDLKKIAKVPVVERDQIDKAMQEIALQSVKGTEESTAARVGKMVGAKTIVIGGIQQAGKQLRITARFVNVETGEVLDTAKSTGPIEDVFALQDDIVAKLIGVAPKKLRPVARRGTQHTVKAYRLYASALTTVSDADRLVYLKQAVDEDPDFTYAIADLARLEERMKGYAKANQVATEAKAANAAEALDSPDVAPSEKARLALQAMQTMLSTRRYHALLQFADRPELQTLPVTDGSNVAEVAAMYSVNSAAQLKLYDDALRRGEAFLKRYPGSSSYGSVEMMMNQVIAKRREKENRRPDYEKQMAELVKDQADAEADAKSRNRPLQNFRYFTFELRKCENAQSYAQYEIAVDQCRAVVKKWEDVKLDVLSDDDQLNLKFIAHVSLCYSLLELGRFDEARSEMELMKKLSPARSATYGIAGLASLLPGD